MCLTFLFNSYFTLTTMCLSPTIKTVEVIMVMHSDQIGVTILAVVPHCQVISFITLVIKTRTSGDRVTGVLRSYRGEEYAGWIPLVRKATC